MNNDKLELFDDEALWKSLSAYSDGEATPEDIAQVEAALRANPAFANELSFLQMTGESARDFIEVEPPARLTDSILSKTSRKITFAKQVRNWFAERASGFLPIGQRYAFASGAAVLLIACGIALSRGVNHSPKTSTASIPAVSSNRSVDIATATPQLKLPVVDTHAPSINKVAVKSNVHTEKKLTDVPAPLILSKADFIEPSHKTVKIASNNEVKRHEAHPSQPNLQLANVAQSPKNLTALSNSEKQIIVGDLSAEESLGANVDSRSEAVTIVEASAPIREPEPIRSRIKLASLSERANPAPPPDAFKSSLDLADKKQLDDNNKELKEQTIASANFGRQFKARIINGSF